jgi:hypothetical protein
MYMPLHIGWKIEYGDDEEKETVALDASVALQFLRPRGAL